MAEHCSVRGARVARTERGPVRCCDQTSDLYCVKVSAGPATRPHDRAAAKLRLALGERELRRKGERGRWAARAGHWVRGP